jgi:hypothetical protein
MVIIYNRKLNVKISIDDSLDWIILTPPLTYQETPHFRIELGVSNWKCNLY